MRLIFTVLLAILMSTSLISQNVCGINHDDIEQITERLLSNKQILEDGFVTHRDGEITYVPIKFHLIGTSTGTQRLGEEHVLRQLNQLNDNYWDQEIQFYIDGEFNYIDNSGAFNNPSSGAGLLVLSQAKLNGRINIFIPNTAMTAGGSIGTTLGFYSPTNDWIVVRKAEFLNLTSTLAHEMGHFLSLLHPHNGWDSIVYDAAIHTPTPATSPGGVTTENEARTGACKNCETAGDFLCDTPPDYNFGFGWNDCDYDVGTLDPCGSVVDVQEDNYMGYFGDCNTYTFTPLQKALMQVDITNRMAVNTIFSNLSPDVTDTVQGNFVANFPEPNGVSSMAQSVYFNWDPIEGATDYIFEVARSVTGFSSSTRVFLTNGKNDVTIEDPFLPNTDYIWRVYPYNQYSTGYDWSETFTFTSGEIVNVGEIEQISSFKLYPNIISTQREVLLDINSDEAFDINIEVLNLAGQKVRTKASRILSGENKINMTLPELASGIYFVKITSATGVISKKLIVQ